MVRFTKEDKKVIAKAQKQEVFETNYWSGETRLVGYRCKKCRRVFQLDIMEVDHIIPKSKSGSDRPSNLQLLCPPCNKKKGSKIKATGVKATTKSKSKSGKTVKKSTKKKATSTKSRATKRKG